jgi:hypothetical protein
MFTFLFIFTAAQDRGPDGDSPFELLKKDEPNKAAELTSHAQPSQSLLSVFGIQSGVNKVEGPNKDSLEHSFTPPKMKKDSSIFSEIDQNCVDNELYFIHCITIEHIKVNFLSISFLA